MNAQQLVPPKIFKHTNIEVTMNAKKMATPNELKAQSFESEVSTPGLINLAATISSPKPTLIQKIKKWFAHEPDAESWHRLEFRNEYQERNKHYHINLNRWY